MILLSFHSLSAQISFLYFIFIALSSIWLFLFFMYFRFSRGISLTNISSQNRPHSLPLISIIVPARNEENCIKRCLTSLLQQNYPKFEVIVVDDNSKDNTLHLTRSISDNRLKVISLNKTPVGWVGKSWASQVGYMASKGSILLFTDADSHFFKADALSKNISFMSSKHAAVITGQPLIELRDIYSKLVMPVYNFFNELYMSCPRQLTNKQPGPRLIGSFFMIEKKILDRLDGFKRVRNSIHEDTDLGMTITHAGYRIQLVKANTFMSAMWSRDKKTLFEGIRRIISYNLSHGWTNITFDLLSVVILVLFPFILLPLTLTLDHGHESHSYLLPWNFLLCGLPMICIALTSKFKHNLDPIFSLLLPLSSGLYLILYVGTILCFILPLPLSVSLIGWKERQYNRHASLAGEQNAKLQVPQNYAAGYAKSAVRGRARK